MPASGVIPALDELAFERGEDALGHGVVEAVASRPRRGRPAHPTTPLARRPGRCMASPCRNDGQLPPDGAVPAPCSEPGAPNRCEDDTPSPSPPPPCRMPRNGLWQSEDPRLKPGRTRTGQANVDSVTGRPAVRHQVWPQVSQGQAPTRVEPLERSPLIAPIGTRCRPRHT